MAIRNWLAVVFALGIGLTGGIGVSPAKGTNVLLVEPSQAPLGPWLDEITWFEQSDRTMGLDEVIAGNRDILTYSINLAADQARALGSTEVNSFPAYPFFDELSFNPAERNFSYPRNPFAVREVREATQFIINRTYLVDTILGQRGLSMKTMWHPKSPEFQRSRSDIAVIESRYPYDTIRGEQQIRTALETRGWSIKTGTDPGGRTCSIASGCWRDPENRLVTIKILRRVQDERFQFGQYYGDLFTGLNFEVTLVPVGNAAIPYGTDPGEENWNIYTAGWLTTAQAPWNDDQIQFYAACGIGEPYCTPVTDGTTGPGIYYDPPDQLTDIADTLAFQRYTSLAERQTLIARGTEIAMQESIRVFVDTRRQLFVNNVRMQDVIFDTMAGPVNQWNLKAATVPPDTITGLRTARATVLLGYVDGWNPWVFPGWLYDSIQRWAMVDPGMARHPQSGRWTDFRTNASVLTAGPSGVLPVPTDSVVFDTASNTWTPVGAGLTATSKVSYDMVFGKWHHGEDITMDDVMYTWANLWRRARGDLSVVPGISYAALPEEAFFVANQLKAIRLIDSDTLEVYIDYWHADEKEIAGLAALFPSAPWEVQEIAAKLIIDQVAANSNYDAGATGRIWLDLTKGDSLWYLGQALTAYSAANEIPPGMAGNGLGRISPADATARWAALTSWNNTYGPGSGGPTYFGNFWPSNGPFFLERVDPLARQTVMKAFRSGYPFDADKWKPLAKPPALSPDVTIEAVGAPVKVTVGSAHTLTIDIRNIGTGATGVNVNLSAYEGTSPLPFDTVSIPPLAPGGTYRATIPWTAPASSALVNMQFVLDPENALAEDDETNNGAAIGIDVKDRPTTVILVLGPNATTTQLYVTPSTMFALTATDRSGEGLTTFRRIDGGSAVVYTGAFSLSAEGTRRVEYWSVDNLGGTESTKELIAVVDATPPAATVSLQGPSVNTNRLYVAASTAFTVSASDGGSGVREVWYRIDSGTTQAFTTPFSVAAEGAHEIRYWAVDLLGNAGSPQLSDVVADFTPPMTDIAWSGPNVTTSRLYVTPETRFALSAQDAGSGVGATWVRVGGGAPTAYAGPFQFSAEGDRAITFWSVDQLGTPEVESSLDVSVDGTPPTTEIVVGAPSGSEVSVGLSTHDAAVGVAYVEYRLGQGAWIRYSAPFVVSGVGSHTVEFRAVDLLGNTETVRSREVRIPAAEAPGGSSIPQGILLAAVIAAVAVLGAIMLLWRRRRGKESSEEPTAQEGEVARPPSPSKPPR